MSRLCPLGLIFLLTGIILPFPLSINNPGIITFVEIVTLKRKTKVLRKFRQKEWKIIDKQRCGKTINWEENSFFLKAKEGVKTVGYLELNIIAGVAFINDLIIAHDQRRKGVGKKLMLTAEKIAKQHHAHKINLCTGKGWISQKFYEALGYKQTGFLPKHYFKIDYVDYTKFL